MSYVSYSRRTMDSSSDRRHSESSIASNKIFDPTDLVNLMPVKLGSRFEDTLNGIHIRNIKEYWLFTYRIGRVFKRLYMKYRSSRNGKPHWEGDFIRIRGELTGFLSEMLWRIGSQEMKFPVEGTSSITISSYIVPIEVKIIKKLRNLLSSD